MTRLGAIRIITVIAAIGMCLLAVGLLVAFHAATFNENWTDENIYLYQAGRLADGALLYRDIPSTRPPLALAPLALRRGDEEQCERLLRSAIVGFERAEMAQYAAAAARRLPERAQRAGGHAMQFRSPRHVQEGLEDRQRVVLEKPVAPDVEQVAHHLEVAVDDDQIGRAHV